MKTYKTQFLTILTALIVVGLTAQAQYTYTPLAYPLAVQTSAEGISGTNIVGVYMDTYGDAHGFLYNGDTNWTSLNDPLSGPGVIGGTAITRISGTDAVGFYWDTNGNLHGFVHSGTDWSTNWTTIDDPNGVSSPNNGTFPWGISGTNIVGQYIDANGNTHGFLYNGSTWTELDDPSAASGSSGGTYAFDISGTNVLGYYVNGSGQNRGFLYNIVSRAWTALNDPLGADGTSPEGISGTNIVGEYWDSNLNVHGFLHSGTNWTTFDDPLAPVGYYPAGGTFLRGIDGPRMVGDYYVNGNAHGFLATPIPQLTITQSGDNLNISWPYSSFVTWTLQQNPDLTTTNWTLTTTGGISNDGTNNYYMITPSPGNLFFRLSQ
jgi:hypothetical protein